jgi:hypothetical protein
VEIEVLGTKMLKRIDELGGLLNKRPAQDGLLERNGRRIWKMMSDGDDALRRMEKAYIRNEVTDDTNKSLSTVKLP